MYGDVDKVVELASDPDITAESISEEMETVVDNWIDTNIKPTGFLNISNADEYYDIKRTDQTELVLKHFPIVTLTELINDANSSSPITLDSSSYYVDSESGIIQLLNNITTSSVSYYNNYVGYFSKGNRTVRVKYTYGYSDVPEIIQTIANLMLAKWAKIQLQQSDADGMKSVRIGNYSETKDVEFVNIDSEFDSILMPLIKSAQETYAIGV